MDDDAVPAIEVASVSRYFGRGGRRVVALDDVSFSVRRGETVALLGTNGAGKTTLTKILSTLLLPDGGHARVMGHDVVDDVTAVRRTTSAIFGGDRGLYGRMTGLANVRFFALLAGVPRRSIARRANEYLEQVGLAGDARRRVETYSKGMKQRLHIAIGLISEPSVLLLDEPTVGLDPVEAENFRSKVDKLRGTGASILLTSHNLMDVERLADRVVLLSAGRVTADMRLSEFVAQAGYAAVIEVTVRQASPDVPARLPDGIAFDGIGHRPEGASLRFRVRAWSAEMLSDVGSLLAGLDVVSIDVRSARLDEAFSKLVR